MTAMPKLHTGVIASVGYEGRDLAELVALLQRNRIDRLIDVRALPRLGGRLEIPQVPRDHRPRHSTTQATRGPISIEAQWVEALSEGAAWTGPVR